VKNVWERFEGSAIDVTYVHLHSKILQNTRILILSKMLQKYENYVYVFDIIK
jgi:hypothetical protein